MKDKLDEASTKKNRLKQMVTQLQKQSDQLQSRYEAAKVKMVELESERDGKEESM